ncbi:MAG: protein-L-isoaspartate(D-aspartate) O-methyltransferase [Rhodospirillales bacterium]|nr:protein-L-isoaspartate(D-aspartate) O-methyltransferase [Rhodospirillales bacterium]
MDAARVALLDEIVREAAETAAWTGRAHLAPRVLQAMARVPRHRFVARQQRRFAYDNRPLPIGYGQTISQPYIVAMMTDLLDLAPMDRVLEIGTGSGYQSAVLAELVFAVFSVEQHPKLAAGARERLAELGYAGVEVRVGDGNRGWPEAAPFDAILVTAAAPDFPPALEEQLASGGRLVIPVGPSGGAQTLWRCVRNPDTTISRERVLPVAFVPLLPGV